MPKKTDWKRPLSDTVKAEVLAATFHLLADHTPEVWGKVPAWLQKQIRQAMSDCATDFRVFSQQDLVDCVEYCQWLNKKHPQPKLRKKHKANPNVCGQCGKGPRCEPGCPNGDPYP